MAIKLSLKKRETDGTLHIPHRMLVPILNDEESGKDRLWEFMAPLKEVPLTVHDKEHLLTIINWVPEGGITLSEHAKWFKLVERVNELDEDREGNFTLSEFQRDLLWHRMTNDKFKMRAMSPTFVGFVMDFQKATGLHFEHEEPEAEGE